MRYSGVRGPSPVRGARATGRGIAALRMYVGARRSKRGGAAIRDGGAAAAIGKLDTLLAARDYAAAAAYCVSRVDWETPSWHARNSADLRAIWESGVDDKWGITPVWRALQLALFIGRSKVLNLF